MGKPRIVSFGELLWDLFPDEARLGGSAANVAFHAAQLGAESRLLSRVGRDQEGERALSFLRTSGVVVDGVTIDPERKTGSVVVTLKDGEPNFVIQEGVAWDAIYPDGASLDATFASDVFCFNTLAQRSTSVSDGLYDILSRIGASKPAGAHCRRPLRFLDLNLRPPYIDPEKIMKSLELTDVVKFNESEREWLQQHGASRDVEDWLLVNFSLVLIACTQGNKGARLVSSEGTWSEEGLKVSGGDPVGAGDAFVASLAISLAKKRPFKEALTQANTYAAWVASQPGAMPTSV